MLFSYPLTQVGGTPLRLLNQLSGVLELPADLEVAKKSLMSTLSGMANSVNFASP